MKLSLGTLVLIALLYLFFLRKKPAPDANSGQVEVSVGTPVLTDRK